MRKDNAIQIQQILAKFPIKVRQAHEKRVAHALASILAAPQNAGRIHRDLIPLIERLLIIIAAINTKNDPIAILSLLENLMQSSSRELTQKVSALETIYILHSEILTSHPKILTLLMSNFHNIIPITTALQEFPHNLLNLEFATTLIKNTKKATEASIIFAKVPRMYQDFAMFTIILSNINKFKNYTDIKKVDPKDPGVAYAISIKKRPYNRDSFKNCIIPKDIPFKILKKYLGTPRIFCLFNQLALEDRTLKNLKLLCATKPAVLPLTYAINYFCNLANVLPQIATQLPKLLTGAIPRKIADPHNNFLNKFSISTENLYVIGKLAAALPKYQQFMPEVLHTEFHLAALCAGKSAFFDAKNLSAALDTLNLLEVLKPTSSPNVIFDCLNYLCENGNSGLVDEARDYYREAYQSGSNILDALALVNIHRYQISEMQKIKFFVFLLQRTRNGDYQSYTCFSSHLAKFLDIFPSKYHTIAVLINLTTYLRTNCKPYGYLENLCIEFNNIKNVFFMFPKALQTKQIFAEFLLNCNQAEDPVDAYNSLEYYTKSLKLMQQYARHYQQYREINLQTIKQIQIADLKRRYLIPAEYKTFFNNFCDQLLNFTIPGCADEVIVTEFFRTLNAITQLPVELRTPKNLNCIYNENAPSRSMVNALNKISLEPSDKLACEDNPPSLPITPVISANFTIEMRNRAMSLVHSFTYNWIRFRKIKGFAYGTKNVLLKILDFAGLSFSAHKLPEINAAQTKEYQARLRLDLPEDKQDYPDRDLSKPYSWPPAAIKYISTPDGQLVKVIAPQSNAGASAAAAYAQPYSWPPAAIKYISTPDGQLVKVIAPQSNAGASAAAAACAQPYSWPPAAIQYISTPDGQLVKVIAPESNVGASAAAACAQPYSWPPAAIQSLTAPGGPLAQVIANLERSARTAAAGAVLPAPYELEEPEVNIGAPAADIPGPAAPTTQQKTPIENQVTIMDEEYSFTVAEQGIQQHIIYGNGNGNSSNTGAAAAAAAGPAAPAAPSNPALPLHAFAASTKRNRDSDNDRELLRTLQQSALETCSRQKTGTAAAEAEAVAVPDPKRPRSKKTEAIDW